MQTTDQRIADLTQAIIFHEALLVQVRADHQRIQDELREARVMLAKLENDEEREATFLRIPQSNN